MTRDWHTSTEADAAKAARAAAYPDDWRDERDEPGAVDTGHDCTYAPFADTCLGCLGWERFWIAERNALNEANNKEWWA